jgi:hypothetical protein
MNKCLLIRFAIALKLVLVTSLLFSQNIITVTDCNLNGWVKQPIGQSSLGFVNGPANPPSGKGSLKFYVPAGGIFWPGDFVRLRNGQYSGTQLSSLTELSYETYVEARDTIADIHFLVVLVDINGDGTAEHNLVFDPRYQNSNFIKGLMPDQGITKEHAWQKWDALHGGWFFGGETITDPDHSGPFFTLAEYLGLYPNATIRNDAAKGGPAIRLTAGGVVFKPNFYGSIDDFKIGISGKTTSYDFEFSTANADPDKNIVYGYGSNCVTLNGSAAGGVVPYTYSWSPGGSTQANSSTMVCPIVTTKYTLTVTDKNGCTRTDEVNVFVSDVRCGDKMDKVKICHKGEAICVAKESVAAHLKHGDKLGDCETNVQASTRIVTQSASVEQSHLKLSNYPNPFSNSTKISFELPNDGRVTIKLYDLTGKELATLLSPDKKSGQHMLPFFSRGLSGGVYYYKITFSTFGKYISKTQKLLVTAH